MKQDEKNLAQQAQDLGWRYCYECISPTGGTRLRVLGECEAYFWYLLGYSVHRMVERTP